MLITFRLSCVIDTREQVPCSTKSSLNEENDLQFIKISSYFMYEVFNLHAQPADKVSDSTEISDARPKY